MTLLLFEKMFTCVVDPPEARVAIYLAVFGAVVHLSSFEVVEELARPAASHQIPQQSDFHPIY